MPSLRRKIWVVGSIIIIFIALAIFIILQASHYKYQSSIVATVNGDPIYIEEFQDEFFEQQIPIQQYFKDKYGTIADSDFWECNYAGENPLKKAREQALKECVNIKVEQRLGREKGLIKEIGYPAFLKQLEKENKRRKEAVENKEVIYGPIEYQKNVYYEYLRSNMEQKLKEILENEELQVSEEDLVKHYEKTRERFYGKEGSIKILKVYINYSDEEERKYALEKIEQVKTEVDRNRKIENILEQKVKYKEQIFDENTAKQDAQSNSEIKNLAKGLSVGKTSTILEENYSFYFIQCVEKEADGYKPFEEVKENVKIKLLDEKYEEFIEGLAKAAKVEINSRVYNQTKIGGN